MKRALKAGAAVIVCSAATFIVLVCVVAGVVWAMGDPL